MTEKIDERIAEYFSKEENLHLLREKLFHLEGYRLQSDIDKEIEKFKKEYEKKLKKKDSELAAYHSSVENELQEARRNKKELEKWKSGYSKLASIFSKFSDLSPKHREAIAGIFGGCDTPLDFLCGSVQKGHLEQLWDYVREEVDAPDLDEQEVDLLSSLFDFSFDAVNRSQREPFFRRLVAPQGAVFDGDTMGRTADSPQLGRVKQMVFAGFAHGVTGSVVRRSLVKLEQ